MPFDQHMLVALVAPRGYHGGDASEDLWADPRGSWLSLIEASKAWAMYPLLIDWEVPTNNNEVVIRGAYLGQPLPGNTPIIFAPVMISTEENELNSVFSCDGNEFYFSRGALGSGNRLYLTKRVNNVWSTPEATPFLGGVDPHLTPRMVTVSTMPVVAISSIPDRMADGSWYDIKNSGANVNSSSRELYPCVVADGSLYFQSSRPGSADGSDIYRAKSKERAGFRTAQ